MRLLNGLRLPRWLAVVVWLAQLVLFYSGAPAGLADLAPRLGWQNRRPGPGNLLGLVLLVPGILALSWIAFLHIARLPQTVHVPRAVPDYLLERGPYRLSRNPMYVAGVATWMGWAVYYGSVTVMAGALAVWSAIALLAVPLEERALEARYAEDYARYKASVPRWLGYSEAHHCSPEQGE